MWADFELKRGNFEREKACVLSRSTERGQSTLCPLIEIDDFVKMWVDALGERATGVHLLAVLLHKAAKVRLRSPLRVVDDAGAVCASVQRRSDEARLLLHLLGEATQLIEQRLLLFRLRLKDVDQRHQVTLLENTHSFPPFRIPRCNRTLPLIAMKKHTRRMDLCKEPLLGIVSIPLRSALLASTPCIDLEEHEYVQACQIQQAAGDHARCYIAGTPLQAAL